MAGDDTRRPESDVRQGLRSFGRAFETVTGRLLGPKVVGKEIAPEDVAISPETDAALLRAGEELGRLLHAAGEGLKAHPTVPAEAIRVAREHRDDAPPPPPGLTALSGGLLNFGGGMAKVAEGVLDVVAPRRTRTDDPHSDDPRRDDPRRDDTDDDASR
jgi:hypothetical protein